MGYDERHQSSSSGVLVAVVVVVLIVILLGILAVLGAGYFFVQTSRVEAMVARERTVVEAHNAEAESLTAVDEARVQATPEQRLNFELNLDREGNTSVNGEKISLDELRTKLAKLKDETSNAFSVRINADPECPAKHIIPALDVCEDVGDIDFRIVSSEKSETPHDQRDAEN
jgi:biopolymer transport protein ExbD